MRVITLAMAACIVAFSATAQTFPSRQVTIVLPFPAGGPLDLIARTAQPKLQADLGQPVVIENRAGATGTIGTDSVVRAAPDGHTVLLTVDLPIAMAPALFRTPYDPLKDLQTIGIFAETTQVFVAHPSVGVKTIAELIAKARAEPEKVTFSSAGNGSPGHLCGEMLAQAAGVKMTHVPYRGAAPAAAAVVGGEVSAFCGPITQNLPQAQAGRVVALAVGSAKRSPLAPDLPTFGEQGFPSVVVTNFYGLWAPNGTPAPVMARLKAAFQKAFADAEVAPRLAAGGIDLFWVEGEAAQARIAGDLKKWGDVIKAGNVKAD